MNFFIRMRDNIRKFISNNDVLISRIFKGLMAYLCLLIINTNFGYSEVLANNWIPIVVAVLCAFVPESAFALVMIIYLFIQLASLSTEVAFVAIALYVITYVLCGIYRGQFYYSVVGIPVAYQLHIPFALPLQSALFGGASEVTTVLGGSVIAYYLKSVKEHASQLMDAQDSVSVSDLLMSGMLANTMFYVFLTAMVVMFLVVYIIRCADIVHAWLIAIFSGVLAEFIIMLAGYLMLNRSSQIPWLIVGNLIVLGIGLTTNYLFKDLDYSRSEKVQFEDDEYYYYVTAVPKIRIESEVKEIKKITEGNPSSRYSKMDFSDEEENEQKGSDKG
ncbi:MAG: hypothetical protein K6F30_04055 [Lachnospiraceae bacterium]|nr:hypothetical protein [Lachnospiraceae bacterium]